MENYRIFLDLAADIDIEFAKENNIGFIPMNYSIDDKEYISKEFLTDEEMTNFYNMMKNGSITKTSQITPFQYVDYLEEYAKNGINILYFTLSSGLSNTFNSALVAKEELFDKYPDFKFEVVDSLAATGGIGVLASIASKNLKDGMSIEDNASYMREATKKIKHWFYVDDLSYLKRGGRVSASTAFVANTLNIKPILKIDEEGKLETIAKKIGTKKSQSYLLEKFFETYDNNYKTVYINHAACIDSALYIKEKIEEFDNTINVVIRSLCPIIGSHTGPNMLAICHMGK